MILPRLFYTCAPVTSRSFLPTTLLVCLVCIFSASPARAQYTVSTSGAWNPQYNNPINVPLNTNQLSGALPIGFNFPFFGNTYSQFYISSNGFITFSAGAGSGATPQTIPLASNPNNLIALAWATLSPGYSEFSYETMGTFPNRTLRVNFEVENFGNGGNCPDGYVLYGQIVLKENGYGIEIHTDEWNGDACGLNATQGIENINGTIAFPTPDRNNQLWNTLEHFVAFNPNQVTDVAVTAFESAQCVGAQNIDIILQNLSNYIIDSVYVDWMWDGVAQDSLFIEGPFAPLDTMLVTLGNKTIAADEDYTLKAWSYNPDNETDVNQANDTINGIVYAGLIGIKTVGGASPDYTTIAEAVTALQTIGVCDSVIFDIRPGTYNENLDIDLFSSSGAGKAIFRSSTGVAADVIITKNYTVTGTNRLIDINQADKVIFRDLTLKVTGSACSNVVYTEGDCEGIEIVDCIIRGTGCTTVGVSGAAIYLASGDKKSNRILNNDISLGIYGIHINPGTGKFANNLLIESNMIDSSYRANMVVNRPQHMVINDNQLACHQSSSYGIEMLTGFGECRITNNSINAANSPYGCRVATYEDNNGADTCLIANNMITLSGGINNGKALMVEGSDGARIYHNSLHSISTINTAMALSVITSTTSHIKNNIISNAGTGKAANIGSVISDHNVFYNVTPPVITNGTNNYNTLLNWQTATSQDLHSMQENPDFISNTDLHTNNLLLNGKGTSLTPPVATDFDGETRNASLPDPGADEFGFLSDDIAVASIYFPNQLAEGLNEARAIITNVGTNTVSDYDLHWSINAGTPTLMAINFPIVAGGSDTIILGNVEMLTGGSYLIKTYTSDPNGNVDNNLENDTLSLGPVYPGVNGLYTVFGAAPDFPTLNAALTAIQLGGVIDSVQLAIRDGFFHDPIVPGASALYNCSKPVRIFSESGDVDDVVFDNANLLSPIVKLSNVKGFHFENITFQLTASAIHNVVVVENAASCNSFTGCKFIGRISTQTTTAYAVILGNSTQDIDNDYYNNFIQYGSFGIATTGPNIATGSGVDIEGNTCVDGYIGGISVSTAPLVRIIGNSVSLTSLKHASYNGIAAGNCKRLDMSHNKVYNPFNGQTGINFSDCDGTSQDSSKVFNNYVYMNTTNSLSSVFGGGYSDYTLVLNNTSIALDGRAAGFSWSANFRIENNIFRSLGNDPALELLNMQSNYTSNHNCLSSPNGNIGEFNNTQYATLAQWQALGYDVNSFVTDPLFDGTTHIAHNALLNGVAVPYSFIADDFDGDPRNPTNPDLGANEFTPADHDGGLLTMLYPKMPFPLGINPVYVRFYNNGGDTLTSLQFNWTINNVAQTPFTWNGLLASTAEYDSLEIGTFDFAPYTEYDIKIWITLPNGMPDAYTSNDTLTINNQIAAMAGIYTIGGESPDFETITEAITALHAGGISDDVTFNIRNGIYAQPIALSSITGSGCDRHVLFQSESGETENVTITNLGINAHTIVLTGTDGVHFKNLSLTSVNTSFRHVVLFSGGAHCNRFEDNIMTGFVSTATGNTSAVIRSTAGLDTANVIIGNIIKEGSWGIHLFGNNTAATGTVVEENEFDTNYRGIYMNSMNGATIRNNSIISDESATALGIEIYNAPLKEISFNKIQCPTGQHGIYIDNCDNTTTSHGKVYNNFISVGGTSVARGIFLNSAAFQDVYHNSVLVYSTNATLANTAPFYLTSNPSLRLYNNASKNAGPGYAIYATSNTTMLANKNSYWTAGSTFGLWNTAPVETTFALWKTNSGLDAQSVNADPNFMSNTDLHTFSALLNAGGEANLGITVDIDGELRDSLPDMGADEFDPLPLNDAGIFMFAGPIVPFANGTKNIDLVLKNFGGNTLNAVTVRWTVNGIEQTPFNWTGTLPSTQCDTITVGTYLISPLVAYQIDAWTELPNGLPDADTDNDLLSHPVFYASLNGTYTVGGFTPNFNLVSELETILQQSGIVGNVTFLFRPGTYTEAILLSDFPRSSYAHTVTFKSESGDSTDVVLTQNTNNVSLIDLDDAHKIIFKELTLRNTKGNACYLRNGTSQITIENCRLEGTSTLAGSRSLITSATTTEDSISILNNVFEHGYYGIYLYGSGYEKRHIIQNNTFLGNYYYGVYVRLFDGLTLTGNYFNAAYTDQRDLYMYNSINASTISGNTFISDNTSNAIYFGLNTNTSPNSTQFVNNFIYKNGTISSDVLWFENIAKINIDFNTIHNALSHGSAAALYTENLTTWNVRNNLFFSHAGAAFHNSGTLPTIHNYNNLFSLGSVVAQQNSTTYSTLAAYAAGTSTNANSKSVNPLFSVNAQPSPSQIVLNETGLTISGITTDISGTTRTSPPDIGAKEFTPLLHDVRLSHLAQPQDGCGLGNETVTAVLINYGSTNATGFNVNYEVSGQVVNENIGAQTAIAGDSLFYQFAQTINASEFETYNVTAWHTYAADLNTLNDTTFHSFTNNPPFSSAITSMIPVDGIVGLENQVSLSWAPVDGAVSYDLYLWLASASKPVTPTHAGLMTINKLVTNLTYGSLYRWQIHAVNICDEELESDTSTFTTRFLPDLQVQSITIPATGFSEQTISVEWVTKNIGPGNTVPGTWFENIYLSPDPTYNSFDPLLSSVSNLTSLNPNQSYSHSKQVVLPQGTNGLYYIIIKTDHYNGVKETLDNNNTTYSATQINVTLSPPPDLLVTNITAPTITFSGEVINFTYTVSNLGSGITTNSIWKDEIKLVPAPNNPNGPTSTLWTRTHTGHLLPDSSYVVNLSAGIPSNIFGDFQIRVVTDYKNDVYEYASEGNNTLLSSIIQVVLTPPVDLVPANISTPDTISTHEDTQISFDIINQGGSSPLIGWTDRYYLSPSPVYNTNFLTHIGYAYHNAGLMPGDTNHKSTYIRIVGDFSGTHYLYVVTDYNNKINEFTFENNNILRSDPFIIIKSDIRPDSLVHVASAMSGSTISLRGEIVNDGPGNYYGNINNRYYLSNDNQLSTMTDILLATKTTNNIILTTTDTFTNQVLVSFPQDQFGAKYLLCHADAAGYVHEEDENNNVLASPITIFESPHADVKTDSIQTPGTVTAGIAFQLQYQLTNIGDRPVTQAVTDSIFISFSPTWNRSTATPMATRVTTLLDTAQVVSFDVVLSTSISQTPNQYYIYIVSDATSKIYEGSGETNNIQRSSVFVLQPYPDIDIKLHSITGFTDTLTSGQPITLGYTVQNISTAATYYGAWTEKWFLSIDSLWSPSSDMLLGTFSYTAGNITANGSRTTSALQFLPHGITGDYYVFVETDAGDLNDDIDRNNNHNTFRQLGTAKKLHIKLALYPDLQPTEFVCPVEITSGQYFDIITEVTNEGIGIAGLRVDKLFISSDNTIGQGDYALSTLNKTALNPGQQQVDTLSVFVPANYSGNYFIIYAIDHGNIVYEHSQEGNNILIASIIATPPPPADLIVKNILVPDSVLAGETATITWETKNQGANPAYGQFREIVYLSPDTTWNLSDEVIGIYDGNILLSPGNSTTKSISLPYNNVTNADYHTIIRTDAKNNIAEAAEDNNEGYSFDLTNVDIEEIFLDQVKTTNLPANTNKYYKVLIDADAAERNILITLTGDSLSGINQLYVKHGAVPTEADNDYAYTKPFFPNQSILVRNSQPGYYYIMANGYKQNQSGPQTIDVLARIIRMEIIEVTPNKGGNKGYVTLDILGSDLDSLEEVRLVLDDTTRYQGIVADTFITLDEGTRVVARFNLKDEEPGIYHVFCESESIWVASKRRAFEIVEGEGAEVVLNWNFNPSSFNPRFNTLFQIKVDVENIGDADAEEKKIWVGTPQYNNPVYYSLQDYYNGLQHSQLLLIAEDLDGFPGVLKPGGRRTYYVFGRIGGTQGFSIHYDK